MDVKSIIHKLFGEDIPVTTIGLAIVLIIFLETVQYLHFRYNLVRMLQKQPLYLRWIVYSTALLLLLIFGVFEKRQFIYFQF
jgi:alginate O-acetyltransferase complex protein AlgI